MIVAAIMAGIFVLSSVQILRRSIAELRSPKRRLGEPEESKADRPEAPSTTASSLSTAAKNSPRMQLTMNCI
ncbi:hypothetical protein [Methyloceanibacter sp.]|uniref:hypothetical protein n=1 Tax=Methyloceanibacter sp. TaxID=1965321 RepID=UPI002D1FAF3C|nr:hypothetical protein [Methyloceanibacter sp.]